MFTRREHTLCVEEGKSRGENCPITGVSFVKKGGKPKDVFPHGQVIMNFNDRYYFVYSRDHDALPVTRTKISLQIPCIRPYLDSIKTKNHLLESEIDLEYSGCIKDANLRQTYDVRYQQAG